MSLSRYFYEFLSITVYVLLLSGCRTYIFKQESGIFDNKAQRTNTSIVKTYSFSASYERALGLNVASYPYDQSGWTAIKFHEGSDKNALNAFKNLKSKIYEANNQEKNFYFEGLLDPKVYDDESGEKYQFFTLTHWYITPPFWEVTGDTKYGRKRMRFKKSDFNNLDPTIDITIFEKGRILE